MTAQALINGSTHPFPTGPAPAATTVAVLSGDRILAEQATDALGGHGRLVVLAWQNADEATDASQLVAELTAASATVLCIGPDVPLELALETAAIIDRSRPAVSVVLVASPTGDLWRDAVRAGVRDVIEPGRVDLELDQAFRRAAERAARVLDQQPPVASAEEVPTARVIVVISPKGGSGKTMVASNLAAGLAGIGDSPVALVDLDVQFGDSATAMGLSPERSLGELATMPAIDSTTLKVFLTPHEASGAFVLCGSDSPEDGDAVTADHAGHIVDLLAADFAFVVVDTPAGLDERTLSALERATDVVCVTSTDVSSIRNMGKEITVLDRLGLLGGRRHFVLNRADARVGIETADIEAALGMTTDATVPSSRAVPLSMNQGRPIVIDSPSSPVGRELLGLTQRIAGRADDTGRRPRLPWRKK